VTIYLKPEYTGKGVGSRALEFLEKVAVEKKFHVLLAIICGENEQSINLFMRRGFEKCGHYREVGRKFGRLLDVVSYQKII
jgi:phosphinothricin acetyltransferase